MVSCSGPEYRSGAPDTISFRLRKEYKYQLLTYLNKILARSPNIFWTGTGDLFRSYSRRILERRVGGGPLSWMVCSTVLPIPKVMVVCHCLIRVIVPAKQGLRIARGGPQMLNLPSFASATHRCSATVKTLECCLRCRSLR